MSIDAISTSVLTSVGTISASSLDLNADSRARNPAPVAPVDHQEVALQAATVLTISKEAQTQQQFADEEGLRLSAQEADASAVAAAASRDWANRTLAVENGAVREALDALDEASRENLQFVRSSAITAQSDQAVLESQTAEALAKNDDAEQRALAVAVMNASIQLAYGALASPLTGDAVLRQPGVETFA
jgi:hypothetical protein